MRIPLTLCLMLSGFLRAEEPPIEVNPNRPTFANPALTTQSGVAELEWGVQRSTFRDAGPSFGTPTLLKLGLAKDLELLAKENNLEAAANQLPALQSALEAAMAELKGLRQ